MPYKGAVEKSRKRLMITNKLFKNKKEEDYKLALSIFKKKKKKEISFGYSIVITP